MKIIQSMCSIKIKTAKMKPIDLTRLEKEMKELQDKNNNHEMQNKIEWFKTHPETKMNNIKYTRSRCVQTEFNEVIKGVIKPEIKSSSLNRPKQFQK